MEPPWPSLVLSASATSPLTITLWKRAMTTNHNNAASLSSKTEGIPFSLTLPPQALDGTIMISSQVDDPAMFVIEFQHAGVRLGRAALIEDGALARSGATTRWDSHAAAKGSYLGASWLNERDDHEDEPAQVAW
jgi:hypothetical protein